MYISQAYYIRVFCQLSFYSTIRKNNITQLTTPQMFPACNDTVLLPKGVCFETCNNSPHGYLPKTFKTQIKARPGTSHST